MRGPTDREEERRRYAASSPLANLVRALGRDVERWLPVALEPLPETFRLTQHRQDPSGRRTKSKRWGPSISPGWATSRRLSCRLHGGEPLKAMLSD